MHNARRAAALTEVILAFVAVHVAFRAIKRFTIIGQWEHAAHTNFTPGAVMILFTLLVLFIHRQPPSTYGLSFRDWPSHLSVGLFACAVLVIFSVIGIALTRINFDPTRPPGMMRGIGGAVVGLFATLTLSWCLRKQFLRRFPPAAGLTVLAVLLCAPLLYKPGLFLTVLWLFFGAGFGEEIFYRGYIQSRISAAFGDATSGILVSSLLFGFLHALNTVDYFRGHWNFAWWFALQSFFIGLFYGVLRARTGSVLPGAIAHGLSDVLAQYWAQLARTAGL